MNNYYYATREELERLDREAVSAGMSVAWMMELAGWHILEVFRRLRIDRSKKVSVIVGKGNKGGTVCVLRDTL
jgi:NAD(P)H-hydrate repair Nnr-like enzyme with NAD(P)H-hydrate epimerase domain